MVNKVLVIDDVFENIEFIKAALSKPFPNIKVLEATSGKKGIQIAREEDPDAILLDLKMPEMDGYEVCEKLKSDSSTKFIPIILISAFAQDSEIVIKGLNLGADVFLKKPIAPSELVAQLGAVLRIRNVEKLLRKESQKYRIMTETLPEAVITTGFKNTIVFSSLQASRLFGYEQPADLLEKNILELFHPEYRKKANKCIEQMRENQILKNVCFKFVKHDNSDFDGELSSSLIMNTKDDIFEMIFVIRDVTERRQSENRILAYQQKLKNMNLRLIFVEEKERKLIAEALHDRLGQILAIVKIKLTSLLHENNKTKIDEINQESVVMIDEAINECKSLTYDLSSPILYELGLQAAIKWKLEKFSKDYGIRTIFNDKLVKNQISDDINILIYRIISELLTNIVKHAKANIVSIQLSENQNNIYLSVTDDGKGFNVDLSLITIDSGFGLFNINERLDSLQGSIKIDSCIGKGTKIVIQIPLLSSKYAH